MHSPMPVFNIELPQPPIGNKIFYASQPGYYILEKGPCVWQAMANTHQSTGNIKVFDGVCDQNGTFQFDSEITELMRNGRLIFNANPPILGMWMFAGGLNYGFTLEISGVLGTTAPSLTITWMPKTEIKRNISR